MKATLGLSGVLVLTLLAHTAAGGCFSSVYIVRYLQNDGTLVFGTGQVDTAMFDLGPGGAPNAMVEGALATVPIRIGLPRQFQDTSLWFDFGVAAYFCPVTPGDCCQVAYASAKPFYVARFAYPTNVTPLQVDVNDTSQFYRVDTSTSRVGLPPSQAIYPPCVDVHYIDTLSNRVAPPDLFVVVQTHSGKYCLVRILAVDEVGVLPSARGGSTRAVSPVNINGMAGEQFDLRGLRLPGHNTAPGVYVLPSQRTLRVVLP